MGKAMFLTGAAVGYVLGARAGRERYEQICRATEQLRANPKVQQATEMATARGGEIAHKVADTATEKAHTMAGAVADKAPNWMPGSRDSGMSESTASDTGMPRPMSNGRTMP
ncbi:YtxH domain-containing protein [Sporichthya brevicatena]|uniref:YtxH domain-containing protein n=1 Tax=Sporichthya brevicatena TaxID=171442 RepID=A0ABP3SDU9_9ACTN